MDNTTTQAPVTAQPAEAEKNGNGAAGLGKFRDVDALLEAYSNLEAEFTRRSQRLRELEKAAAEQPPAQAASASSAQQPESQGANLLGAAQTSEEVKSQIIAEYLAAAARNRGVPLISGGVNVPAQRRTPSTVREAGALAQQFLNKRR